jgi:integrase
VFKPKGTKFWWIAYHDATGKRHYESSESELKSVAQTLLDDKNTDKRRGVPVSATVGKVTFKDAADDLLNEYKSKKMSSYRTSKRRIDKHLEPYFGGWLMANVSTDEIRRYTVKRQEALTVLVHKAHTITHEDGTVKTIPEERKPASDAEINRELATLKRMFTLAIQARKLLFRPHIPMLKERNVRKGFLEPEQVAGVVKHLQPAIQPVVQFAAITGWRIKSEVLPLEWRNVDFEAGEVRLDAHTTKNDEARVFPMTIELRRVLQSQHEKREQLKKAGHIIKWVFWRMVAEGRGGDKRPQPIISFNKAWKAACRAAGCPGRIPHDLRRTAIRTFVRRGISEPVAMKLSGHKTASVFRRYNITSASDLRDAARRLDAEPTARVELKSRSKQRA